MVSLAASSTSGAELDTNLNAPNERHRRSNVLSHAIVSDVITASIVFQSTLHVFCFFLLLFNAVKKWVLTLQMNRTMLQFDPD